MISDLNKNSILLIKQTVAGYQEEIKKVVDEINGIDEKYKKIIAEETYKLRTTRDILEAQMESWNKMLSMYEDEEINKALESAPAEEPEEKVVDNDAEEVQEEPQVVGEPADEPPLFDGAGFTEEDNEPASEVKEEPASESFPEAEAESGNGADSVEEKEVELAEEPAVESTQEESWETEEEESSEEIEEEEDESGDGDDWPEMPQSWD